MAIDIKITSDDTIEHKGKQYRPVAIRSPKQSEKYLSPSGNLCISGHGFSESVYIILEEVVPPYRTPTDEDALKRPTAEFWGRGESPDDSKEGMLLGVLDRESWLFVGVSNGGVGVWQHCRIPNEK